MRVQGDTLALTGRPDRRYPLTPLYADAFDSELGTIVFRRAGDRVTEFSVVQDRVWDLRFRRVPADGAKKRILAFGDSNTWGWIPVERGFPPPATRPASAGQASRRSRSATATRSSKKR